MERKLDHLDIHRVTSSLDQFETVMKAQLAATDAYFVTKKGGYDTVNLIADATTLFSDDLATKVPKAVGDIQEAGKCIAFELGTAAAFHILRANEVVLLAYWKAVTKNARIPKNRNIGAYIKGLEEKKVGDPKVLATLRQIKDLHRNSLMHPEDTLTIDEAINLLGIIRSVVTAMLKEIPDPNVKKLTSRRAKAQIT